MKSTISKLVMASPLIASLTSCSDFLEKEPLSEGTEAIVFKNATQFQQAADAFTEHLPSWQSITWDKNTDIGGLSSNGAGTAPENNGNWSGNYNNIRQYNILLKKAEEYTGDKTAINASVGTAYFFRGMAYFNLLKTFGGVPIVDHVMDVNDEVLYGPRNSRYEVFNFLANDFRKAIELLPKESSIAAADKGRISKEVAQAFFGRVLLYEATWEKYVPSINYDLDGNGTENGAGKAKPEGYPSTNDMFSECKQVSKAVMDEAQNNGTYSLWNECDSLSYYYLFNIDDNGGNISNFKNVGKDTNHEFILYKKYDYDLKRVGFNIGHIVDTWQGVNISAQFGESFLCRNGLPIRISRTGKMEDAENNPEFEGWSTFAGEYHNRDYRFVGCAWCPDRASWGNGEHCTIHTEADGKPYPDPLFVKNNDKYDSSDPAYASVRGIFRPKLRNNTNFNDYGCRKYMPEGNRPTRTESPDLPLLRLAEVYLNYAEATCELGNGQISDEDLNLSINKLRDRARVAHLTNALIKDVWDAGWWDYKTNKTVCHKMNMLDEIRRERACELFGEGFRMDDLKRWGIAHINLRGQKLGRHVLNTAYTTNKCNDNQYFGEPCYYPEKYPLLYGVYEGTGKDDPDYGRSIATLAENLHYTQRDYLDAIPLQQIRLNPALTQNPGW